MQSKDCTKSLYGLADFHQPLFEFLVGAKGRIAQFHPVIVDGGRRFLEELRNLGRFAHAQADEGEDAQLVAQLTFRQVEADAFVFLQQVVQLRDEVRENAQEGAVKFLEQDFPFGIDEIVGFQGLLDFLEVLGFGYVPQGGAIAFQAADVPVGSGWVRPSFPSCFPS